LSWHFSTCWVEMFSFCICIFYLSTLISPIRKLKFFQPIRLEHFCRFFQQKIWLGVMSIDIFSCPSCWVEDAPMLSYPMTFYWLLMHHIFLLYTKNRFMTHSHWNQPQTNFGYYWV
jgi:hypothetical protein